jgi:predicted metalloprotease
MALEGSMNRLVARLAVFAALMAPASTLLAAGTGPASSVTVTARDVAYFDQKAAAAHSALVTMWTNEFAGLGRRFDAPALAPYRNGYVRSACGLMSPQNAAYCPNDNTIYFDDVFVASQAKQAAASLGSDGDMTAVAIIAHEMGHAVAMQLGFHARDSYTNEATADCLAGAFAKQAQTDGTLEAGDIQEALYGMAAAGDPEIQLTGNVRRDRRIEHRYQRVAHGTPEQRVSNFRAGLSAGGGACLTALR